MAGAFNQFATGIGNTDASFILGTGKLLIKVPESMPFFLEGKLPAGVMAKDVILHVIGDDRLRWSNLSGHAMGRPKGSLHVHGRSNDHCQHGNRSRRKKCNLPV
jgi:homoaconitase/3-isopropylmalate dehydratase large subunit